ncbi:U-box domain-containing protein 30-like [Iris pallida]|uniref:U-box domain-containing protein n=1 Tax=Iris pallida TaxID=29817 RepID=A0AAX6I1A3_IRIPA|nr:U-box domain-containing protein 30-like [Iris pallida]KAJ6846761.1 U-box domain-containing protein 30-like [Iris pallida]
MPRYEQRDSGHVIDVETAVKDGILGGASAPCCAPVASAADKKLDLKKMIDELDSAANSGDAEVPAVFICPISLSPMTDPVTLCTGQTYDRPNILRWLSFGNPTCPTTMQELWDRSLTPNRTLLHLIHAWFSSRYLLHKKRADDVIGRAADLTSSLKRSKGQSRVQLLKDLRALVASHPSTRKSLSSAASVALISSLLGPFTSHAVGSEAISILVHLSLDADSRAGLSQPAKISLVIDLLNEGTIDTKVNCVRFLEMLMEGKDFRPELVSSLSLLVGILRLVKDKRHPNGVSAGLCLLKTISGYSQLRPLVVSIGTVPQVVDLLPELSTECLQPALQILDDLSGVPEGQLALKECERTIPNVVRLLMRVSEGCTQCALSILWAVCRLDPGECGRVAVEAGLAAKLLLVIQSGCDQSLKQRSAELLKLCSLNYTPNNFISKCKLTRTIQ